jgi:hypothetical protein
VAAKATPRGPRVPAILRRSLGYVGRLAAVVGAITVVAGAAIYVGKAVEREWFWRSHEYDKLTSLIAGMPLARFVAVLGAPVFARDSADDRYRESTFSGRGYWVQTVSVADGTVVEYAVTACARGFTPTFPIRGTGKSVTLQRTRMLHVDDEGAEPADYFVSGTGGGRSHFYNEDLGGNGTYYKQLAWGFNDACPQGEGELAALVAKKVIMRRELEGPLSKENYGLEPEAEGVWLTRLQAHLLLNTFAETSANVQFATLKHVTFGSNSDPGGFEIGVDRLLTRQLQP